jgi:hypothetical protein
MNENKRVERSRRMWIRDNKRKMRHERENERVEGRRMWIRGNKRKMRYERENERVERRRRMWIRKNKRKMRYERENERVEGARRMWIRENKRKLRYEWKQKSGIKKERNEVCTKLTLIPHSAPVLFNTSFVALLLSGALRCQITYCSSSQVPRVTNITKRTTFTKAS